MEATPLAREASSMISVVGKVAGSLIKNGCGPILTSISNWIVRLS